MKKGFTLIELLAVIIILAVIALIATPVVLNVVEEAKIKANKNSVYGLVDAAKLYYAESLLDTSKTGLDGTTNLLDKLVISGKKPESGTIFINKNGDVSVAVVYDDICYTKSFNSTVINNSKLDGECKIMDNANDTEVPTLVIRGEFDEPKRAIDLLIIGEDNNSISEIKYEIGEKNTNYFISNGINIENNSVITIDKNGIYTFYIKDAANLETIKQINITNIDDSLPNDIINIINKKLGTETSVEINTDSITNVEYKIGNGSWVKYESAFNVTSYDYINNNYLVDGKAIIYAKYIDGNGKEVILSKEILVLDVELPNSPVIVSTGGYPVVSEYGINLGDYNYVIFDDRTDIDNYYSTNEGETWEKYNGNFEIGSSVIMAKSVKKSSGLTVSSSKTIEIPTDALSSNAYDGKDNTSSGDLTKPAYMYIDDTMKGQSVYIYGRLTKGIIYVLEDGTETTASAIGNNSNPAGKVYQLPENIVKIKIPAYSSGQLASDVYEIRVYSDPVINGTKHYPVVSEYGVKPGYNTVEIKYFKTSVKKLYRINEGDWKEYNNTPVRLEIDDVIECKGVDANNKETLVTSYKAVLPTDALSFNAYDGFDTTKTGDLKALAYINIDDTMKGQSVYIYGRLTKGIIYVLEDGTETTAGAVGNNSNPAGKVYQLPENIVKIKIPAYSSGQKASDVYEIRVYSEPVINGTKHYQTLSQQGVKPAYNTVEIKYFKTSVKKLYRINEGDWKEYNNTPVRLEIDDVIECKGVDINNKETLVTSYKAILPDNTLAINAYDNDTTTSISYSGRGPIIKYLTINSEMHGKKIKLLSSMGSYTTYGIKYYDQTGNEFDSEMHSGSIKSTWISYEIPENTAKIGIYYSSSNSNDWGNLVEVVYDSSEE